MASRKVKVGKVNRVLTGFLIFSSVKITHEGPGESPPLISRTGESKAL
jgi:hypothetical protein